MKHQTITANSLKTISWLDDTIVDWASAGNQYTIDGNIKQLYSYHLAFKFDGAMTSNSGEYAFVYQRLGTKGLLLKKGEILREINRSYYCADIYEYPCAFLDVDFKTYLIHCPIAYDRLDFEDVETGTIITDIPDRKSPDIFHSRLEVSPDNSILISKGWVWHPLDVVYAFDIKKCIDNPNLLDEQYMQPPVEVEICSATFIDNERIIIGSTDALIDEEDTSMLPNQIAVWNLKTNDISKPVSVDFEFGSLFAIDENRVWDLYDYPKIIDINTGKIEQSIPAVNSGKQQSSIIMNLASLPQIVFNRKTKQIAITGNQSIEVLTP